MAPLSWGPDDLLPQDVDAVHQMDMPLSIYRSQRVRRAVGFLPPSRRLPDACASTSRVKSTVATAGQFRGACRIITWNTQAFFCHTTDDTKFHEKIGYLRKLLDQADFILVTESHGTDGGNKAWNPPSGSKAWWSAGSSAGWAGVGVIARMDFLAKFSQEPEWKVLWLGRAAILSLRSPEGSLDVVVSYFHTGKDVSEHDME